VESDSGAFARRHPARGHASQEDRTVLPRRFRNRLVWSTVAATLGQLLVVAAAAAASGGSDFPLR